jgi:sugar (pentulose or hexulose) kinase
MGAPVAPLSTSEGSALGAAAMAAYGVGEMSDIREITSRWVTLGEPTEPEESPGLAAARASTTACTAI